MLKCFSVNLTDRKATYLLSLIVFGNLADNSNDPRVFIVGCQIVFAVLLATEALMISHDTLVQKQR